MAILKNITFAGQTPFEPTTGYLLDVTFGTIILLSGLLSILLNSMVLLLKVRPQRSQTNILFSIQSIAYIIIAVRSLAMVPSLYTPDYMTNYNISKVEGLGHTILDTINRTPLICSWLLSGSCMLKIRDGFITIKSRWMVIIFSSSSMMCLTANGLRCVWGKTPRYFYQLTQTVLEDRCNFNISGHYTSTNGTTNEENCLETNYGLYTWFTFIFILTTSVTSTAFSFYSVFLLLKRRDAPEATEANTKKACKTLIFMNLTNVIYIAYFFAAMQIFSQSSTEDINRGKSQIIALMIAGSWLLKVVVAVITPFLILYFGYSLQSIKSTITSLRGIKSSINRSQKT